MKANLSYLGPDVEIEGQIVSAGPLRIDGHCDGSIDGKDRVTVGTRAHINGSIRAQVLVINGQVVGDLISSEKVAILSNGNIAGDVYTPEGRVSVAKGGMLKGGFYTDQMPELTVGKTEDRKEVAESTASDTRPASTLSGTQEKQEAKSLPRHSVVSGPENQSE